MEPQTIKIGDEEVEISQERNCLKVRWGKYTDKETKEVKYACNVSINPTDFARGHEVWTDCCVLLDKLHEPVWSGELENLRKLKDGLRKIEDGKDEVEEVKRYFGITVPEVKK